VIVIILAIVFLPRLLGGSSGLPGGDVLEGFPGAPPAAPGEGGIDPDAGLLDFVDAVTDDAQTFWSEEFRRAGKAYQDTEVVLFSGGTNTGCGQASSATGPFYCPADRRVYLDLTFFRELERQFGAPGDFAQAYVITHEVAHHVQTLLGINGQVQQASREEPSRANDLSIRLELQADCFAGVWGKSVRDLLEPGDVVEGLTAASAVGDDRIQEATTGRVNPESWTHGSAEQRSTWLRRGLQTGLPDACDTFSEDI
jgi:predicted metalloprotease